jgi:hypothetical protein
LRTRCRAGRGAAYGLRQSPTDRRGVGPLAIALLAWLLVDIRTALGRGDPGGAGGARARRRRAEASLHACACADPGLPTRYPRRYWLVVALGAVLTLARFRRRFVWRRRPGWVAWIRWCWW